MRFTNQGVGGHHTHDMTSQSLVDGKVHWNPTVEELAVLSKNVPQGGDCAVGAAVLDQQPWL